MTSIEPKPIDSRILLTKRLDLFEVVIPARGTSRYKWSILWIVLIGAPIPFNIVGMVTGAIAFESPVETIGIVLFLILWTGFTLLIALPLVYMMKGETTLRIDSETISLSYELFGYVYQRPKPAQRSEIVQIGLIERGRHCRRYEHSEVCVRRQPSVEIWTRDRIFNLIFYPLRAKAKEHLHPRHHIYITRAECLWLYDELRTWLDVPARIVKPNRRG